jgi:hypothetical protein
MEPCHSLCVAAHLRRGPQTRGLFSSGPKSKCAFVSLRKGQLNRLSFFCDCEIIHAHCTSVSSRSPRGPHHVSKDGSAPLAPRSTQVLSTIYSLSLPVHSIMLDCSVRYRSLSPARGKVMSVSRVRHARCATPQRPRVPSTLIRNFLVVDFCRARARHRRGGSLSIFICTPCRVRCSHLLRTIIC